MIVRIRPWLHVGAIILVVGVSPLLAQGQPVPFQELMKLLPLEPPPGWEVSEKPRGTTVKAPVQMSEAEVEFSSGDKTLAISIMDPVGQNFPPTPLDQAMEMESSEGYTKSIEIQGFKGVENYQREPKEGEIILKVGDRFLVSIRGHGLEDNALLRQMAAKLDLKKLAALAPKEK